MKMKKFERHIFNHFRKLNASFDGEIPLSELRKFVRNNFEHHTFDNWLPPDFRNHPTIIDYVQDYTYK